MFAKPFLYIPPTSISPLGCKQAWKISPFQTGPFGNHAQREGRLNLYLTSIFFKTTNDIIRGTEQSLFGYNWASLFASSIIYEPLTDLFRHLSLPWPPSPRTQYLHSLFSLFGNINKQASCQYKTRSCDKTKRRLCAIWSYPQTWSSSHYSVRGPQNMRNKHEVPPVTLRGDPQNMRTVETKWLKKPCLF